MTPLQPSERSAEISQVDEFKEALESNASIYDVELTAEVIGRLARYYKVLSKWNPALHLVAPCSPREFAARHVMESLLLLPHLPHAARVADIGSGAGLPIIPCLIARQDLNATLIESSKKKAVFLREALSLTQTSQSATIVAERFEDVAMPEAGFVTCRALDHFAEMFPRLIQWSPRAGTLLLFGGETLRDQINNAGLSYTELLIPNTERRFLFVVARK